MLAVPRVFRETNLPQTLPHCSAEIEHLARRLEPAAGGKRADDRLLTGPSGVEKTVLSRQFRRHLEVASEEVVIVRVQCLGLNDADVLRQMCAGIGLDPGDRWMVTDLHERLLEETRPAVIVLEETGDIPDSGLIDYLD